MTIERGGLPESAAVKYGRDNPDLVLAHPQSTLNRLSRSVFNRGLRSRYHHFEVELDPNMPENGPAILLTTHFSFIDIPALELADPYYPPTGLIVKKELFNIPGLKQILKSWGAFPVDRSGKDLKAIRHIKRLLHEQKRTICIAAEGTRSRTGHLGPMDEVLLKLSLDLAKDGVPVIPTAVIGSNEAMPPGWLISKPGKIKVVTGPALDLSRWNVGHKLPREELEAAAFFIRDSLAQLLPEKNRPLPNTPPIWVKQDYIPKAK